VGESVCMCERREKEESVCEREALEEEQRSFA